MGLGVVGWNLCILQCLVMEFKFGGLCDAPGWDVIDVDCGKMLRGRFSEVGVRWQGDAFAAFVLRIW